MTEETIRNQYLEMGISGEVYAYGRKIEKALEERFRRIDEIAELNQMKVIHAM